MQKKYWLLVLIIVIIAGSIIMYQNGIFEKRGKIEEGTEPGMKAPSFTLQDISGEEKSLTDYRGQKVFLNFWATWCPPCKQEMPDIQKLQSDNDDIEVVTVNLGEDKGKVVDFLIRENYSFPVLLDKDRGVGNSYLVRGIPTSYLLDEEGIIIKKHVGAMNYRQMNEFIE